jgi:hypothetical protein
MIPEIQTVFRFRSHVEIRNNELGRELSKAKLPTRYAPQHQVCPVHLSKFSCPVFTVAHAALIFASGLQLK